MRWSVVRLIASREIRDQLRDRRTLFLILGLPILMYPLFVGIGLLFVSAMKEKKLVVGIAGAEHLPKPQADMTGALGGAGDVAYRMRAFPTFLGEDGQFAPRYAADAPDSAPLTVTQIDTMDEGALSALLSARQVDAIVVIDPDTAGKLQRGERPSIRVLGRDGEENSKLAVQRVTAVLQRWGEDVKAARFARAGLPPDFDRPLEIRDPQSEKTSEKKMADELRDVLVKVIPFLLVMWMLTGAIYPAIDMTAGEKERGTMETLLISPAERTEIVAGKFLATTMFGFGTAMWNVLLLLVAVAVAQSFFPYSLLSFSGLAACTLAAVPLAMLFAACALALGIFARSTKEGNYYMVPLFFIVLPLAYWSMTPGIELDGFTSWVPMANALLFQQRLMSMRPDPFPWQHVPAVFGSLGLCVALALWAAVRQFHRESVLFRESQAGSKKGWSLFGRK
ncbi:MAG: ABC transporter permease subunit [Planctomycetia bacterium]|nr:ABC transporter permease subunit [Planctomycetia bacterium]